MIVEPDDAHPWEQLALPLAAKHLTDKGVPADDANWIGPFLLDLLNPDGLEYSVTDDNTLAGVCASTLDLAAEIYTFDAGRDRNTWLMLVVLSLTHAARVDLSVGGDGSVKRQALRRNPKPLAERCFELCKSKGLDVSRAFAHLADHCKGSWMLQFWDHKGAAEWFFRRGAIDVKQILTRESLPTQNVHLNWRGEVRHQKNLAILRTLVFWIDVGGAEVLFQIEPWVIQSQDSELLQLIPVLRMMGKADPITCRTGPSSDPSKRRYVEFNRRMCQIIAERHFASPKDLELRHSWWVYSLAGWAGTSDACPYRDALASSATEYWGKLRPLIRNAADNPEVLRQQMKCVASGWWGHESIDSVALNVLSCFSGQWSAIKALLLAFRALPAPAVQPDLRCLPSTRVADDILERLPAKDAEEDRLRRSPWLGFAHLLISKLDWHMHEQKDSDQELSELRSNLAEFFLERLKPKEHVKPGHEVIDAEMKEPSRHWRRCYIRAVRDLRCNPGHRGHRVLFWSSKYDPSPEIRKDAEQVYNEIRNHVSLQEGRSPRSAVLAATWWLRQAHLLELGVAIDEAAALRTRAKEARGQF